MRTLLPILLLLLWLTRSAWAESVETIARTSLVATSQPQAVQVGIDILKHGGNAIDVAMGAVTP